VNFQEYLDLREKTQIRTPQIHALRLILEKYKRGLGPGSFSSNAETRLVDDLLSDLVEENNKALEAITRINTSQTLIEVK